MAYLRNGQAKVHRNGGYFHGSIRRLILKVADVYARRGLLAGPAWQEGCVRRGTGGDIGGKGALEGGCQRRRGSRHALLPAPASALRPGVRLRARCVDVLGGLVCLALLWWEECIVECEKRTKCCGERSEFVTHSSCMCEWKKGRRGGRDSPLGPWYPAAAVPGALQEGERWGEASVQREGVCGKLSVMMAMAVGRVQSRGRQACASAYAEDPCEELG